MLRAKYAYLVFVSLASCATLMQFIKRRQPLFFMTKRAFFLYQLVETHALVANSVYDATFASCSALAINADFIAGVHYTFYSEYVAIHF